MKVNTPAEAVLVNAPASGTLRSVERRRTPLRIVVGLEGLALGGCPINALDLSRALRDRGHEVSVFAIDEDVRVSLVPYAEKCGFEVTLLPTRASFLARAQQIRRLVRRQSADIVHVFGPWLGPAASIAACSVQRRSAIVTNWTMENVSYTPRRTSLIVGTRALQTEASQTHRAPVWLMEPPVDIRADAPNPAAGRRFRQQHGITDDEVAAVIVSRLDTHMKAEGIGYAMRAVMQLDEARLKLVIVGDGNAFEEIERQARKVNSELQRTAVILAGPLQDPRPAYAGADIMLGMGGSALRSLAHGKPLVVLGERGFARLFEPESVDYFYENGFYGDQPQHDPVGHLARELRPVLADGRRRLLGDYGLGEVRARFSLETSVQTLENVYYDALDVGPKLTSRCTTAASLVIRGAAHEISTAVRTRLNSRSLLNSRSRPNAGSSTARTR